MGNNRFLSLVIFIVLIFISCREEIIPPGNFAGDINEPVQENSLNYFSFMINAQDFTQSFFANTNFNYPTTKIIISVFDRTSGSITIRVKDESGFSMFNKKIESNKSDIYQKFLGYLPSKVEISSTNFTGKFKISLSDSYD
jgi:hypothetical protein